MKLLLPIKKIWLPLLLHLVFMVFLFQVGFTTQEWKDAKAATHLSFPSDPEVLASMPGHLVKYIRYFYISNSDELLYRNMATLALNGDFDKEFWTKSKLRDVPLQLPERPWPYKDVMIEYPPLAFLVLLPPALIATSYNGYIFWFGVWITLIYLVNLWLILYLFSEKPLQKERFQERLKKLLWWSFGFVLLLGNIVVHRFDAAIPTFMLLAALAFERGLRHENRGSQWWVALSGVISAAGVLFKIVPGLVSVALVAAIWFSNRKDRLRLSVFHFSALLLTIAGLHFVFWNLFGDNYWRTYFYHVDRGIQLESTYSGLLLALGPMLGVEVTRTIGFGSDNVSSNLVPVLGKLSQPLFLIALGTMFYLLWKASSTRKQFKPSQTTDVIGKSAILMVCLTWVFILTNKVFSPQYLIWVAPLMLGMVVVKPEFFRFGVLFLVISLMTQGIFPRLYYLMREFNPFMVALLNARNLLSILLVGLLFKQLLRMYGAKKKAPVFQPKVVEAEPEQPEFEPFRPLASPVCPIMEAKGAQTGEHQIV